MAQQDQDQYATLKKRDPKNIWLPSMMLNTINKAFDLARLQHLCRSSLTAARSALGTSARQVRRLLLGSWVNVLLLCAPAGLALNYASGPALAVFIVNFLAAVGILGLGDSALECITCQVGTLYGSLLYISTSNLMQMISSIVLLVRGEYELLQVSLVGSLLANILLLPALSILYAAYHGKPMAHDSSMTRNYTLLLSLAIGGFIIPTVFDKETILPTSQTAAISRAVSVLLMVTYGGYLYLQLSTHRNRFDHLTSERNEKADELQISIRVASAVFVATTALLYFSVDFVVDSLQDLGAGVRGSWAFTGVVLIPVLNCDVAAVEQAGRSMDLMLMFTMGKCTQSALLVAPLLVVVAWGLGADGVNLSFDIRLVVVLFVSLYVVNSLVAGGSLKWLHGWMLLALYALIAMNSWWYPMSSAEFG